MKLPALLLSLLLSTASFAQLTISKPSENKALEAKVGEVKNMGVFIADLTYRVAEKDTVYTIMYKNAAYTTLTDIKSISFESEGNTVNELYAAFKTFFSDENRKNKDYKLQLKLGETDVFLSNLRTMGVTRVMIFTARGHFYLTEKQLDTLFGRSE